MPRLKRSSVSDFQLLWQGQLSDYVMDLVWSPDGRAIAACSAAGEVSLISAATQQVALLQTATQEPVDCLAFSYDGQYLAAGGQAGRVRLWRIQSGTAEPLPSLEWPSSWIDRLAWSPTMPQLAFSLGKSIRIWDAEAKDTLVSLNFESSSVFDLAWRGDGQYLALAGYRGVRVWSALDWQAEPEHLEIPSASVAIAWSKNGQYIASGNLDHTLTVTEWGVPYPWLMQGFPGKVRQLTWSQLPTRSRPPILAACSGDTVVVWRRHPDGRIGWSHQRAQHQGKVQAIAFQPNWPRLASAGEDGSVCLWSADLQLLQALQGGPTGFSRLSWHPAGHQLVAGGQTGEIWLWSEAQSGQGFRS